MPLEMAIKIISEIANLKLDIFKIKFLKIIIYIQFENKFSNPKETKNIPLKVGIIWLNFLSSKNFFKFSAVAPATINGVTWPIPKKNKKTIEIVGFFACDTQARRVAKTGVMQGEEASPKVVPMAKGAINVGILSSIIFKSGPFGSWNFRTPNKFKPIIIAIKATNEV